MLLRVGQTTCCVRLHNLLHVVACWSNYVLRSFAQSVACCCVLVKLRVAFVCTICCMLLRVGQTLEPTTPNISSFVPLSPKRSETILDPFVQLFQHCWHHAHYIHLIPKWPLIYAHTNWPLLPRSR